MCKETSALVFTIRCCYEYLQFYKWNARPPLLNTRAENARVMAALKLFINLYLGKFLSDRNVTELTELFRISRNRRDFKFLYLINFVKMFSFDDIKKNSILQPLIWGWCPLLTFADFFAHVKLRDFQCIPARKLIFFKIET